MRSEVQIFPDPPFRLGAIAQLGERLPCTQEVVGSIPSGSTTFWGLIRCFWKSLEKKRISFLLKIFLLFNNLEISDVLSGLITRYFFAFTFCERRQVINSYQVSHLHVVRHGSACTAEQESKGSCQHKRRQPNL